MIEIYESADESYDAVIAEAITAATLPLVTVTAVEALHRTESQRLANTPSYEFI